MLRIPHNQQSWRDHIQCFPLAAAEVATNHCILSGKLKTLKNVMQKIFNQWLGKMAFNQIKNFKSSIFQFFHSEKNAKQNPFHESFLYHHQFSHKNGGPFSVSSSRWSCGKALLFQKILYTRKEMTTPPCGSYYYSITFILIAELMLHLKSFPLGLIYWS